MDNNYKIYPLRVGTVLRKGNEDPVTAFYLEGEHKILVDTGGVEPDGVRWMPYWRNPGENIPDALRSIDVDPEDIEIVIITHLHWDHAGNNKDLPDARFLVQKKEYEYLSSPPQVTDHSLAANVILATDYELLDGDAEIVPGVRAVFTAGHSPGMQSVLIDTEDGPYVLAGDAVIKYAHWNSEPKVLNDWGFDSEHFYKVMDEFDKMNAKLLPFHDMAVFDRRSYP